MDVSKGLSLRHLSAQPVPTHHGHSRPHWTLLQNRPLQRGATCERTNSRIPCCSSPDRQSVNLTSKEPPRAMEPCIAHNQENSRKRLPYRILGSNTVKTHCASRLLKVAASRAPSELCSHTIAGNRRYYLMQSQHHRRNACAKQQ